jgi:hypothetical protein
MSGLKTTPAKTYVVDKSYPFLYPEAGDPSPGLGMKVQLLTVGGVCVTGHWVHGGGFIGWAPLPCRDIEKEAKIRQTHLTNSRHRLK